MPQPTSEEQGDDTASELSYLHQQSVNNESVTGDLLASTDAWHDAREHTTSQDAGHTISPVRGLFAEDYRPLAVTPLSPVNGYLSPRSNGNRPSPSKSLREEKTPTARQFALADTRARNELVPSPRTVSFDVQPSERRYYGEEASPTLPSPWDHPSFSQPSSPSLADPLDHIPAIHSLHASHGGRPRYGDYRPSATRSPQMNAGIVKRGSLSSSHRKNPSYRLSGNGAGQNIGGPPVDNDGMPLWQQQLGRSADLSRSNSSRSGRKQRSQASSRRASRNFDLDGKDLAATVDTADSATSLSQASALANALAKLEMMQSSPAPNHSVDPGLRFGTQRLSSASHAGQARRFSDVPGVLDNHNSDANGRQTILAGDSQQTSVYSTPTAFSFSDSRHFPASASPMRVSSATAPSFSSMSADSQSPHDHSHTFANNDKLAPVNVNVPLATAPFSPTPAAVSPPDKRRNSLSRTLHIGTAGLSRKLSLRSRRTPATANSEVLPWQRAQIVTASSFLEGLRASRGVAASLEPLVLDVRPLHVYLGDAGRIRGSVNVNFPSLLVKRFRKGNTTSFSLESFITTESGKAQFRRLCPDGNLSQVSLYVLDEHITLQDYDKFATTGSIGAVLVNILEKQRALDKGAGAQSTTYYLECNLTSLLNTARKEWTDLFAEGADVTDLNATSPASPAIPDSVGQPAPAQILSSSRLAHSRSETSLADQGPPKRMARKPPFLTIPATGSTPAMLRLAGTLQAPPPSPGLFRSYSESDTQVTKELPESQIPGLQRKPPPIALQRLDCSDRVRKLSGEGTSSPVAGPSTLAPSNGGFANRTGKAKLKGPPPSLGPSRSLQEIAMQQASTPTAASFARAANARLANRDELSQGSDDFASEPPKTPLVSSHNRNISTDSTASSSSSGTQYPSFANTFGQRASGPKSAAGASTLKNNNNAVVPFDVSVIIPGFLYLGPEPVRESDAQQLESVGIKRILNMAVECDTYGRWNNRFEKIATIPMRDSLAEVGVQDRIREACVLLDDADLYGKPTYVHCKAGKSRSVTIVLAFLVHRNHWPLKRAYAHVSERRKGISPNIGFVAELMRFEEAELGSRSQGVLGSGNTPVHEQGSNGRGGYFRTHSRNGSIHSSTSSTPSGHPSPGGVATPNTARSESGLPTALDGRPTIVRHLSLIASTAMNLSADQAGSKAAKDAQTQARNARVRESLPPGVGFAGMMEEQDYSRPGHTRTRSRTGIETAPPLFVADL